MKMVWMAWLSKRLNERSMTASIAQWWALPLLIALECIPANTNGWAKFVIYSLLVGYPFREWPIWN